MEALVSIYEKGGLQNHGHRTPNTNCTDCQIVNRIEEAIRMHQPPMRVITSGLRSFADRELRAMGYSPEGEEDPNKWIYENIMDLLDVFCEQGHSGTSAMWVIKIFERLTRYQPLGPLTGADSEWNQIGDDLWQNNRCYHVFKGADGQAYDMAGLIFRDPNGTTYQNPSCRLPVTFPYTPEQRIEDVPAWT